MTLIQLIKASGLPIAAMAKRAGIHPHKLGDYSRGMWNAITLTEQETLRGLLIDEETDDNDGLDWEALANKYEVPPPTGAQYWGMGSFYKLARGRVWVYVDNEWIKSSKTEQIVMSYTKVEEKTNETN